MRPSRWAVSGQLYCTVLYCTTLYCTALHCALLYHTVLYCAVPHCAVLYCTAEESYYMNGLHSSVLFTVRLVLYCIVQYCTVLYCTVHKCIIYCETSTTQFSRIHDDIQLRSAIQCSTVHNNTVQYKTV